MKFRHIAWMLALLFSLLAMPAEAEYTAWADSTYNFKKAKVVYIAEMDTSDVSIESAAKEWKLKEELVKRAGTVKGLKVIAESPKTKVAQVPGSIQKASEEIEEMEPVDVSIPQEAIDAGADLYIRPTLTTYQVDSYLEPAHTEWHSKEVREAWKDKDGNWHEYYRTVNYPVFIPDTYIPYADVTVTFEWYDTKTGALVASSEDERTRNAENNPQGVYQRIIDRFLKNMKKEITG